MNEFNSDPIRQPSSGHEPNLVPGLSSSGSASPDAKPTGSTPAPPTGPASIDWETILNQAYGRGVEATIQTGQQLMNAKLALGHGAFGALFAPGRLKFSQRRAEMFMLIARCPVLADPKNFSNLPVSWSVLHALSKVLPEALTAAIANGQIGPETTLKQARALASEHRGQTAIPSGPKTPKPFDEEEHLNRLCDYLEAEAAQWPPNQLPDLAAALREFANRLARPVKGHS